MRFRPVLLGVLTVCLLGIGPFGKKKGQPEEVGPVLPTPPRTSIPADIEDLWTEDLPFPVGEVPEALGSLSAQNCSACHIGAHSSWEVGSHASSARSEPWRTVAHEAADPQCSSCHLPLAEQWDEWNGDANPRFSATLATEGVTCATCHVRDGAVIAGRPGVQAPHPTKWSPQLGESSMCASCHQLEVQGAERPLYDTFGEWTRSPQGKAGVTCQACHSGPGASTAQLGSDHGPHARRGAGLTALIEVASLDVVRGGEPVLGLVRLQNTGAGHHIPTGSPFAGLRIRAAIEIGTDKGPWRSEELVHDLVQTISAEPPYTQTEDTRLAAGEEREVALSLSLPADAPPGKAELVLTISRTSRGTLVEPAVREQRLRLRVD